jgi:hypothetical protein
VSGIVMDSHDHAGWDTVVRQTQPADPDGNVFLIVFGPADGKHIGTVRFRMPDPPDATMTIRIGQQTLQTLRAAGWDQAARLVVVAYGPPHITGPVVAVSAAVAAQAGLEMYDMVMVREGRAWSYLCPDEDHHAGGAGLVIDPLSDTAIQVATVMELGRDQEPG